MTKMNGTYQEGNLIQSYGNVGYTIHFNIPEYLQPIVWRKTHDVLINDGKFNIEELPVECIECKEQSIEGIWCENLYICKYCSCKIMSYFENSFF